MGNCEVLPSTGASVGLIVVLAVASLIIGVVAMRLTRRRGAVMALMPLAVAVAVAVGGVPAEAANGCPPNTAAPTVPSGVVPPPTVSTVAPTATSSTSTSSTTTSSTSTSSTSTSSTSTTTAPLTLTLRDDDVSAVVGVPLSFDYYANDDLRALPDEFGRSLQAVQCGPLLSTLSNDGQTGVLTAEFDVAGTCEMTYSIQMETEVFSAVIRFVIAPAP